VDLRDYLRVLRKRWRLVTACLVLGAAVAAAITWNTTPKYKASTQLFVSARDSGSDLNGLAQGGQFTQQRVQSYAKIVNSPEVAAAAASALDGELSAEQIAGETSASAPLNTVLINVQVLDTSPSRAQAVANAMSDAFARFISDLETPVGASDSPVKVSVVKRADLPMSPVTPNRPLNIALGCLIGLAAGVGIAVLRETLDTSIKDASQVQRERLTPLGSIAYDKGARKRPLIVHVDPHSPRAEAFRQLRTNLQFVDVDRPPRSIVITSSVPNEGKTTTATNLAIALAQSGVRVLLIEADLRRPLVAHYLGIEGAAGLTSVLIGRAQLSDVVQRWGENGDLHVLSSGPMPPNPSELLGSKGMADLIREAELSYDLVLIDAPPLLPVTDAAVVSAAVSGAILVVRHGHTRREQLAKAADSLRAVDANILGAVMTMTPAKGPGSYGYSAGYRSERKPRTNPEKGEQKPPSTQAPRSEEVVNHVAGAAINGVRTIPHGEPAKSGDPLAFFER
jgi:non-specific protein-tyrosine kinase